MATHETNVLFFFYDILNWFSNLSLVFWLILVLSQPLRVVFTVLIPFRQGLALQIVPLVLFRFKVRTGDRYPWNFLITFIWLFLDIPRYIRLTKKYFKTSVFSLYIKITNCTIVIQSIVRILKDTIVMQTVARSLKDTIVIQTIIRSLKDTIAIQIILRNLKDNCSSIHRMELERPSNLVFLITKLCYILI